MRPGWRIGSSIKPKKKGGTLHVSIGFNPLWKMPTLVAFVAADYVLRQGVSAIPHAREQAEIAEELGDDLSAETWIDIAVTAARLLQSH